MIPRRVLSAGRLTAAALATLMLTAAPFAQVDFQSNTNPLAVETTPPSLGGPLPPFNLELTPVGSYATGIFDESAAEIVAHDPKTQRLFVVNGEDDTIDVIDIADPTTPNKLFSIDLGGNPNSVDVDRGVVAVAVEADDSIDPGFVKFYTVDGVLLNELTVGALPDMLTFTPNGKYLLVANEGEPLDYCVPGEDDPMGSISVIDLGHGGPKDVAVLTQDDVSNASPIRSRRGRARSTRTRCEGPRSRAGRRPARRRSRAGAAPAPWWRSIVAPRRRAEPRPRSVACSCPWAVARRSIGRDSRPTPGS